MPHQVWEPLLWKVEYKVSHRTRLLTGKELGYTNKFDKKYYVIFGLSMIHFGDSWYPDYLTLTRDERRKSYRVSASKIIDKDGRPVYKDVSSLVFQSYNLLW